MPFLRHVPARRHLIAAIALLALAFGPRLAAAAPGDEYWGTDFGFPGAFGSVYASAIFGGQLVVGGAFTAIGGTSFGNLALWDGPSLNERGHRRQGSSSAPAVPAREWL